MYYLLLLYQGHYTDCVWNMSHYPGQHMRRWCACTALGQYIQHEIHRYQVCMQTIRLRCKRQLCCASWHLQEDQQFLSLWIIRGIVIFILISEVIWWSKKWREGTCFNSFLLLQWWRWKFCLPTYLLALRSNPTAQEHKRITHRNFKFVIFFWSFLV